MKFLTFLILILISGCSTQKPEIAKSAQEIQIIEINSNKWTNLTRNNLEQLFKIYDLSPLLFTKEIHIESRVVPHSHPILTLNTKYAEEPYKLLSLFIHEQLHWWLDQKTEEIIKAKAELKILYPSLPDVGIAKDTESTYLHFIICSLEYELLIHYLGLKQANIILKDLIYKDKIYPWIYKEVYKNFKELKILNKKYDLKIKF
jgi:hypothetical protein